MKGFQFGKKMKFGKMKGFTSADARRWKREGLREFQMVKKTR